MLDALGVIGDIFKPAAKLIDDIHTSDEERLKLKNKLVSMQNEMTLKILGYEKELMRAQADVIKAEASGSSWLQRSWRPITMLTFLVLAASDSFGLLKFRLAEQAWTLLQIGLGGYVIGRSAEKAVPSLAKAIGKKDV